MAKTQVVYQRCGDKESRNPKIPAMARKTFHIYENETHCSSYLKLVSNVKQEFIAKWVCTLDLVLFPRGGLKTHAQTLP